MYLNQKDLKKIATAVNLAGRINELERIEPYVPSEPVLRRKAVLKKQLKELLGEKEKEEQQVVNIKIELGEGELKEKSSEKSYSFNLKDLLRGKKFEDLDEPIVKVLRGFVPDEEYGVIGKIIDKL